MHMELPLGTEGRNATHDFLSLYFQSSAHAQHDPAPPPDVHLKTHDFLQPLERDGKHDTSTKEGNRCDGMAAVAKPPMRSPPVSADHILPDGVGAYSISYFHQRVSKPEGSLFAASQACSTTQTDENSNCSSYTGSGFTLWDESADKKGKTGKENVATERHAMKGKITLNFEFVMNSKHVHMCLFDLVLWAESGVNVMGAQWTSLLDRTSPPSSFHKPNHTAFSSFSSSQLSSSQNDQSLIDMITSTKNEQEENDDDNGRKFIIKQGFSSHLKGNFPVKVESKAMDQKPSTPRSKHSATEQRRRSKINDRFQKLREVIPNSDQKRDKASFLLEVVEYIQFLQEKVNRYESSCNSWGPESSKMIQWKNCHPAEGFINHTRGANTEIGSAKLVGARFDKNKGNVSPTNMKKRSEQPGLAFHPTMQQQCIFSFGEAIPAASFSVPQQQVSNTDKTVAQSASQVAQQNRLYTANCNSTEQETTIDSDTINISSNAYSQGLLNTLTKALHSSGVDLSQACISVKINLGKGACSGIPHSSAAKDVEIPAALPHFKTATSAQDFGWALKRLRTS